MAYLQKPASMFEIRTLATRISEIFRRSSAFQSFLGQ
jgi:hypothetical protein